jgi:hypothetical protein
MKAEPLIDGDGNKLWDQKLDGKFWIRLQLKKWKQDDKSKGMRWLGYRQYGGWLVVERNNENHFYRLGDGFGFCYELFRNADHFGFDQVRFKARWKGIDVKLTVADMLANFQPMTKYKKQGFERQVLLTEAFLRSRMAPGPAPLPEKKFVRAEKKPDQMALF